MKSRHARQLMAPVHGNDRLPATVPHAIAHARRPASMNKLNPSSWADRPDNRQPGILGILSVEKHSGYQHVLGAGRASPESLSERSVNQCMDLSYPYS